MGYTVEQSRALLVETQRANPGPYYYLGCGPAVPEDNFDASAMLDNLRHDKNLPPCANLKSVYEIFRRDHHADGRWGIWVSAGDPQSDKSPVLMLDTSWLDKAVKKVVDKKT